jgi:hypothetical protein
MLRCRDIFQLSLAQTCAAVYRMGRFEHPEAKWSGRRWHTTPQSTDALSFVGSLF